MTGSLLLDVLYLAVATGALAMTRAEARASGGRSPALALAGLLACALWPLTLAVMAASALAAGRARPQGSGAPQDGAALEEAAV